MPTGYTAKLIESGQTFQDFALTCARAFVALIEMRDDPLDAPIREAEPSDYYVKSLREHTEKLHQLCDMSAAEQSAHGEALKADRIASAEEYLANNQQENLRIDRMIAEVQKWIPPTPDHNNMKEFMLEQLRISRHDGSYPKNEVAKARQKQPAEYFADELASQARGIEYCKENMQKDADRTKERNEWVRKLRESLEVATVSK